MVFFISTGTQYASSHAKMAGSTAALHAASDATEKAKAETASGDHVTVGTATKAKAGKASGDHATDAPKTGGKKAILDWPRLFDN